MIEKETCSDCLVEEGEYHLEDCDWEHCATCGKQTLGFGFCDYNKREPFFMKPFFCAKCGKECPEMFMVDNKEWLDVCGVTFDTKEILCEQCYDFIRELRNIPKGKRRKL